MKLKGTYSGTQLEEILNRLLNLISDLFLIRIRRPENSHFRPETILFEWEFTNCAMGFIADLYKGIVLKQLNYPISMLLI